MATDALLTDNDREEALSRAYVRAVAGFVGYTVSEEDFDRDGIDMRIHAGGRLSPAIGLQLKATIGLGVVRGDGTYHYEVPKRNYDRLIRPSQIPRYLVVLALLQPQDDWLTVTAEALTIHGSAFWVSLLGSPESTNRSSVTVSIPMDNRFDPEALRQLIDRSRDADYDDFAT